MQEREKSGEVNHRPVQKGVYEVDPFFYAFSCVFFDFGSPARQNRQLIFSYEAVRVLDGPSGSRVAALLVIQRRQLLH